MDGWGQLRWTTSPVKMISSIWRLHTQRLSSTAYELRFCQKKPFWYYFSWYLWWGCTTWCLFVKKSQFVEYVSLFSTPYLEFSNWCVWLTGTRYSLFMWQSQKWSFLKRYSSNKKVVKYDERMFCFKSLGGGFILLDDQIVCQSLEKCIIWHFDDCNGGGPTHDQHVPGTSWSSYSPDALFSSCRLSSVYPLFESGKSKREWQKKIYSTNCFKWSARVTEAKYERMQKNISSLASKNIF